MFLSFLTVSFCVFFFFLKKEVDMPYKHDGDHAETYSAITVKIIRVIRGGGAPQGRVVTALAHRRVSLQQALTLCEFDINADGVHTVSTVTQCQYSIDKAKLLAETPWEVIPLEQFLKRFRPRGF
jgi:hypothetical protein